MINYHSLYYFYISAEKSSFSKAAEELGISQPSLSMQIKSLEEDLGFDLFTRNGRSISLTVRGQRLFSTAEGFFELNEEINRCVEDVKAPSQKDLLIGVSDQIERPFIAEMVSAVIKKQKIKTDIFSSTSQELVKMVKTHRFDFIISHEKLNLPWSQFMVSYPVYLVTSKKVSSPGIETAGDINKLLDYFGEDLIIPSDSIRLGKEFQSFRKKNKIHTKVILESNIISCLIRSVADGLGSSFLPLPFIKSSLFEKNLNTYGPKNGYWDHLVYVYSPYDQDVLLQHPLAKRLRNFTK